MNKDLSIYRWWGIASPLFLCHKIEIVFVNVLEIVYLCDKSKYK